MKTVELIDRLRRTEYDDLDACKAADIIEHLDAELAELKIGSGSVCVSNFQHVKNIAELAAKNEKQSEEIASLKQQVINAQRDAKRYRWLTQHAYIAECYTENGPVLIVQNTEREVPITGSVNGAIDAAITAQKESK